MQKALQIFPVNTKELSGTERRVFDLLAAAAAQTAPLYEQQKNTMHNGGSFYPLGVVRDEIREAAIKNPEILNPYTFVIKDSDGSLAAIPYSRKFAKELQSISKLLERAAILTKDTDFSYYLEARAKDLLRDNYTESNVLWLQTEQSKIGFVLGSFDRYHDQMFFKKRAFTSWLGVLDRNTTLEMEVFKEAILSMGKYYVPDAHHTHISSVRIRFEDTAVLSGLDSDFLFVSNNLPSSEDLDIIEKYGTLCTTFRPMLSWRFTTWIYPISQTLKTQNSLYNFSSKELAKAFMRISVFDEVCHSLMRYKGAAERLQEAFAYFDEVHGDISVVKSASYLFSKGVLSRREFEAIIIAEICQGLYYITSAIQKSHVSPLVVGYVHLLEFLIQRGGLKRKKNEFVLDSEKIFLLVDELSYTLEYYLAFSTREEIQAVVQADDITGFFREFEPYFKQFLKPKFAAARA
jgi:hypothetical protein